MCPCWPSAARHRRERSRVAYLVGYLGNVLPVPGGIGVLDGGLVGALVLSGAHAATAAAGVLVYHAIALWLPTALGTAAFLRIRRTLDEPHTAAQFTGQASAWATRLPSRRGGGVAGSASHADLVGLLIRLGAVPAPA